MPERSDYDAIVIGGGHNGLVAAAYLARAGLRTLVLERRPILGGAAASEESFPGYCLNLGPDDVGMFRPEIARELELESYGLRFVQAEATALTLLPDGTCLTLWRDPARAQAEIARLSSSDAARYPEFLRFMARMSEQLESIGGLVPPPLSGRLSPGEILPWLRWTLGFRRMGRRDMYELLRAVPMSASELMQEWFESPAVQGAVGSLGVAGSMQGPMGSGTALMMLYAGHPERGMRAGRYVLGGTGQLIEALAAAARAAGAEIQSGAEVHRILTDGQSQQGIVLAGGERLTARAVLSSADPRTTLLRLLDPQQLEIRTVRNLRNVRYRGSTARVFLALGGFPAFRATPDPAALGGHILICPSLEYLERAYDQAKYGQFSSAPFLDVTLPSVLDPALVPTGRHLLSATVRYAPYHLRQGDWDQLRQPLAEVVVRTLEQHAPGLEELILDQRVVTPLDLEREYALPEGSIYHGQMAIDQLMMMRPIPGYGHYRSPVDGLYFCGAGAHPGGGLSGAPGRNAARLVLRRL